MTHGSSQLQSPQDLQCKANILLHCRKTAVVGGEPIISTGLGGFSAIVRSGPISFLRHQSAPLRSRIVQVSINNRANPGSSLGNISKAPKKLRSFNPNEGTSGGKTSQLDTVIALRVSGTST